MNNTLNLADAMWDVIVDYEHLRTRTMQLRSFADVFCQRYADTADANKAAAIVREDHDNFTNLALLLYDLIYDIDKDLNRNNDIAIATLKKSHGNSTPA